MLSLIVALFLGVRLFSLSCQKTLYKALIFLFSMHPSLVLGKTPLNWQEQFAEGAAAYENGSFAKAIELWDPIAESGEISNGHLLYNLGNAYYRQGQLGEAVACYLGARAMIPRDRDLQHNLQIVAQKVKGSDPGGTSEELRADLAKFFGVLSIRERLFLAGLLGLGVSIGMTLRAWKGFVSSWQLILIGLIAVFFSFAFYFGWKLEGKWGAVIAKESSIHSGPSDPTSVVFTLNEGAAVRVTDETGNWLHIVHITGRSGWIEKSEIRVR